MRRSLAQRIRKIGPMYSAMKADSNGRIVAVLEMKKPKEFDSLLYDLSHDQPLRLGFGQNDYFTGKMKEVRTYNRALSEAEIKNLAGVSASKCNTFHFKP
jgi:hypothetical protein